MGDFKGKTVWIVGASSGIGAALAAELDRRGAKLVLTARRGDELAAVNRSLGDRHCIIPADVADEKALAGVADNIGSMDSAIFMAAVYTPTMLEDMDIGTARQTVEVNIMGALNFINAVYGPMRAQKHGQIVLCGSVAGYCGLPTGQPYGATKAAVINLAESLRVEAAVHGIDVRVINPGFVRTPLTAKNNFEMPMIMEPEDAARTLADGLLGKQFEIRFPVKFTRLVRFLSRLPYPLFFKISSGMLEKRANARRG
ncbi:MAG: SDR family NAD(P)-dependent oxidoreductase [Alphaproteobacteria bacterium]|nr:SDR family NAD(P)-dependent oxidoreductase [Alphaproteobacteria bacterium]